jgi:hypothetical protein
MNLPSKTRLDAAETIFFQRELESIKAKSYDVKYPELKCRRLIPVSFDAGSGADSIVYQQYDQVGMAKIISAYGNDLPRADITGKEFVARVKSLGASYGYNLQEIRSANMAGKPLQSRKAAAAKRAVLQLENRIAYFGDPATGLVGLINNPNVTSTFVPVGVGASTLFANKTPDEILADLNGAANFIVESTNGVEIPDTLLLPLAQYNYIKATPRSALSDTTILSYFLANNGYINTVEWVNELKAAGTNSADLMVCYRRDPDVLTLEIPQDFEQLPEQEIGLEYVVNCHQRIGGVLVYYPMAVNIVSGI